MPRLQECQVTNEHLVWDDRTELYIIGPDAEFRDCQIDIGVPARRFIVGRSRFINCKIRVKRELKNCCFCDAYIEKCRLKGRFSGSDFGRRVDYEEGPDPPLYNPEAGIVDTDLSAARLDGCRFINCELPTLRLPRWPCFTICDPVQIQAQALQLTWPGLTYLMPRRWDDEHQPTGTVAITYDARVICKEDGVTEAELKAVLAHLPGVIM